MRALSAIGLGRSQAAIKPGGWLRPEVHPTPLRRSQLRTARQRRQPRRGIAIRWEHRRKPGMRRRAQPPLVDAPASLPPIVALAPCPSYRQFVQEALVRMIKVGDRAEGVNASRSGDPRRSSLSSSPRGAGGRRRSQAGCLGDSRVRLLLVGSRFDTRPRLAPPNSLRLAKRRHPDRCGATAFHAYGHFAGDEANDRPECRQAGMVREGRCAESTAAGQTVLLPASSWHGRAL